MLPRPDDLWAVTDLRFVTTLSICTSTSFQTRETSPTTTTCVIFLRSASKLQGHFSADASKNASAEAENTEKSSGAFTPRANVIESAKAKSNAPFDRAIHRVNNSGDKSQTK
jgi:hypothetical protein